MEEKINKVLKEHGLTQSDLTEEELKWLRIELELREEGTIIFDGVLSNIEAYYQRKKTNKPNSKFP